MAVIKEPLNKSPRTSCRQIFRLAVVGKNSAAPFSASAENSAKAPFFPPLPTKSPILRGPLKKLEIRQDSCVFLPCQTKNLTGNPHTWIYYFGNSIIAEVIKFDLMPFRSPLAGQPRNMAFIPLAMGGSCKSWNDLIAKVIISASLKMHDLL